MNDPHGTPALKRNLGVAAVAAIVMGNMLGSGIFFTPGELAGLAQQAWQVHFIWALSGLITLCGALTLAELCVSRPHAGATYHIVADAYGPLWGFMLVWLELWVTGPGAIASSAVALGEFLHRSVTALPAVSPVMWGAAAIVFFTAVNLAGVQWGGRTQVLLTAVKIAGVAGLVVGGLWLAARAPAEAPVMAPGTDDGAGLLAFLRFTGLGIAAVLFTYDGWLDVTNVAGEVRRPARDLPIGLGLGVAALTALYVVVNVAYLRVVPLEAMREAPAAVASTVASAAFGARGAALLNGLMTISIFGALGGLVMTQPRLFYSLAAEYAGRSRGVLRGFFALLGYVTPRTAVPAGAILFTAAASLTALAFFGSFSRLVNFSTVPLQVAVIFMVAAVFRLRAREASGASAYRTPGYPLTPIVFILVMAGFVASAVAYRPAEPLIGMALGATGGLVFLAMRRSAA
jgi:APA family basic amino acid/polyamine antiporter